jgi:ABC-type lipoprotein release transport system permease subunit
MYKMLQTMKLALKALLGSPLRTALTMLGMVIGVAAVILLTSLGNGVQGRVTGQIGNLGTDTVQVNPGSEVNDGPFGSVVTSTLTVADARCVAGLPRSPRCRRASRS